MRQTRATMKYLIGVDEVGRGPIAGPVAVGAFIFLASGARKLFHGVKESKQLSAKKREEWFERIVSAREDGVVDFQVSFKSEKYIDQRGISRAIQSVINSSLASVLRRAGLSSGMVRVLLDGGIKAPRSFTDQLTIIGGDAKEEVIALASICAKVLRDRRMIKLAEKYPQYGFESHKGYGTNRHYRAIKKHGLLSVHRKSFLGL